MECTERRPFARVNELADYIEKAIIDTNDN